MITPNRLDRALQGRFFGPRSLVTAVPSTLGAAGSSFGVTWAQQQQPGSTGSGRVLPGFGA